MPIAKVSIKNYKSLENFTLNLKPFMVFVGPNNAGKSNIFDCFRFLSDLVKGREGIRGATIERGGFEQVVFNGDIARTISIELQGSIEVKDKQRFYRYMIEVEGDRWGHCYNRKESFSLVENRESVLLEFPTEGDMATTRDERGEKTGGFGAGRDHSYLYHFHDEDRYPILWRFSNEIQSYAFFNLLPPAMHSSLPVKRELSLQRLGENLPIVLHTLQTEYPQRFKQVEDILRTAVPELEELTTGLTAHEPGQTYIRIREKDLRLSIPAWAMSDGTLRLLGHLAALHLPTPPPLICFEEPENYVHPRLLELMVDLLKNASDRTQVWLTTHSPYLVDLLEPEDLFIVEKQAGKTQVKKAEEKKGIRDALKALGRGEMWYSGSLGVFHEDCPLSGRTGRRKGFENLR